jgi:hypothetical protein
MKLLLADIKIGKWRLPFPALLWFVLAALAAIAEIGRNDINNFLIFKQVFWHTLHQQHLYIAYPAEYFDTNHYGPVFSILIAPFALLPKVIGCFLWCIFNAWVLFYAIEKLSLNKTQRNGILLISAIEMMTSIHNVQFNPMLCGWVILTYVLTEKKQYLWATFFIAAGFYVKLYGIIGVAFFWFAEDKIKFVLSFILWLVVLFCLPMLISSPAFIIQSYKDWFDALVEKNALNVDISIENGMQDISLLGMIRRIFSISTLPNFYITIPGGILYALPFLRFSQYKNAYFKLSYLAFALIGVVIFSSSAESPTYVIAVAGVAIWYVIQGSYTSLLNIILLVLTFLLTILSPTDIVPRFLKDDFIIRYSLKALPCFLVWSVLIFQLLKKDFSRSSPPA